MSYLILRLLNGAKYEGSFENGVPNGKGVLTLANGDRFEGEFVQGEIYGEGTYFFSEKNTRFEGIFQHNQ